MEPFRRIEGVALPLLEDNVDTDAIAPLDVSRHPDYAAMLFRRRREAARAAGSTFIVDDPAFAAARIFVGGANFGCGSPRESAVWSLMANGIRCVVARGFADSFRQNCLRNGVLPVTLNPTDAAAFAALTIEAAGRRAFFADLEAQGVGMVDDAAFSFAIDPHERAALLEGLDDIGLTLRHLDAIEAWERATAARQAYLQKL